MTARAPLKSDGKILPIRDLEQLNFIACTVTEVLQLARLIMKLQGTQVWAYLTNSISTPEGIGLADD